MTGRYIEEIAGGDAGRQSCCGESAILWEDVFLFRFFLVDLCCSVKGDRRCVGNITDYVNNFQHTFRESAFSEVDSLVLCQLSYLKMKHLIPGLEDGADFLLFQEIAAKEHEEQIFADERYREDNQKLVEAVLRSRRFAELKLNYYIDILDKEMEIQFSAVTCCAGEDADGKPIFYIAYRGTDENLVGWKEDFTLAFSEPVVGQLYAARYMRKAAGHLPGDFYLGGHSKGGNLAVFAAMSSSAALQERIREVFSHDGPGFKPQVLERYEYERISEKVNKILPGSSLVGMLLENGSAYHVVESSSFGLWQHNPYTWVVDPEEGLFLHREDLKNGAKFMDTAVTDWILGLDDEQVGRFSDVLFKVLGASEADNLIDFKNDWKKSLSGILQELKELDEETRAEIEDILKELFDIAGQMTKREIQSRIQEGFQGIQEKFSRKKEKK